jgi:hypothetical protein
VQLEPQDGAGLLGQRIPAEIHAKNGYARDAQHYTEEGSDCDEQDILGKQLSPKACAPGTDSGTHGEFPVPSRVANQEQVSYIRARHDHDQTDEHEQNSNRVRKPVALRRIPGAGRHELFPRIRLIGLR